MADLAAALDRSKIVLSPSGRVVIAGPQHEDGLFDLLLELQKLSPLNRDLPPRAEKVREKIKEATEGRGGIVGVIPGDDGVILGSVGLFLQTLWWSDYWMINELWLFTRPEVRHNAAYFRDLFEFMGNVKRWMERDMKTSGYPGELPCISSHATGNRIDAKDRLWSRFGERIGSVYLIR